MKDINNININTWLVSKCTDVSVTPTDNYNYKHRSPNTPNAFESMSKDKDSDVIYNERVNYDNDDEKRKNKAWTLSDLQTTITHHQWELKASLNDKKAKQEKSRKVSLLSHLDRTWDITPIVQIFGKYIRLNWYRTIISVYPVSVVIFICLIDYTSIFYVLMHFGLRVWSILIDYSTI